MDGYTRTPANSRAKGRSLAAALCAAALCALVGADASAGAAGGAPSGSGGLVLPLPAPGSFVLAQLSFKGKTAAPKPGRSGAARTPRALTVVNRSRLPALTRVISVTQAPRAERRTAAAGSKPRRLDSLDYVLIYRAANAPVVSGSDETIQVRYTDRRTGSAAVGLKTLRLATIESQGAFLPKPSCDRLSSRRNSFEITLHVGQVYRTLKTPFAALFPSIKVRTPAAALAVDTLGFGCGLRTATSSKDVLDNDVLDGSAAPVPVNKTRGGLDPVGRPSSNGTGGSDGSVVVGGGDTGDDTSDDTGGGGDGGPPDPGPGASCEDGSEPECPVPANTTAPSISPGSAGNGTTLTCSNGAWQNFPQSYAYKWLRGSTEIGSSQTYTTQTADRNAALTCQVKATNGGGSSDWVTSSNSVTPTWSDGGGGGGGGGCGSSSGGVLGGIKGGSCTYAY